MRLLPFEPSIVAGSNDDVLMVSEACRRDTACMLFQHHCFMCNLEHDASEHVALPACYIA